MARKTEAAGKKREKPEPRNPLPRRDPKERARDFEEVALGFDEEAALAEARRCLQCKRPTCVEGCPVGVDIPGFILALKEKRFAEAVRVLKDRNNLPGICGRVCPQETQCEEVCVLARQGDPVAVGALERFVADWDREHGAGVLSEQGGRGAVAGGKVLPNRREREGDHRGVKVAVIGSGPGGLTAAADLARYGYRVTIFESLHAPGGVLRYGIPEFRMPREILDQEVAYVESLGVEIETDVLVGKTVTLDELREEGFEAFFVATGAGLPWFLHIPGENLAGVYSANEFLTRVNLMQAYRFPEYRTPVRVGKRTAVIGGGNTAMDSARSALRLGSEVSLLYRRTRAEMPARAEEVENALAEGVVLRELTIPVRMLGDKEGHVRAVECLRAELGEPDASGRRRPVAVEGSEFDVPVDTVIVAVSQSPNPLLPRSEPDLETRKDGRLVVNPETGETNMPGVFAGGDIANDAGTVFAAMGDGKRPARAIHEYLERKQRAASESG
ncbi:MAG: NADPH-dependent glutamate synthase [Armatimonadota bacterium]|nr:MAG: NADPH-dependent glutamate synthase [Armatimonadota bacterium]